MLVKVDAGGNKNAPTRSSRPEKYIEAVPSVLELFVTGEPNVPGPSNIRGARAPTVPMTTPHAHRVPA